MTTRPRRIAQRLLEVFDWRTFAVAGAFVAALLVGYLVFSSFQAAHDATVAANQRGQAATRRIDLLNKQIESLQEQIASGRDVQGQLTAAVAALSEQIRQLGGQPVVMVQVTTAPAPSSASSGRPTASPSPAPPRPSVSPSTSPRPSASPSSRVCVLGICPL